MNTYQIKHIHFDFIEHKMTSNGVDINVDQKALDVLKLMVANPGKPINSDRFMDEIWGDKPSSPEVVPAAISRLRKLFKMAGVDDELIETVHKVGYKFLPPEEGLVPVALPVQQRTGWHHWLDWFGVVALVSVLGFYGYQWIKKTGPNAGTDLAAASITNESASNQTQVYILRHTEKMDASEDSPLSEAGRGRAAYWREVLKYIDFDLVYTTGFKRNRETAGIIAEEFNVKPELYQPMSFDVLKFITQVQGKKVLIIGHSNTIPDMANRLLGETKYPPMSHDDYNQLILITINQNGETSSSQLHIEAPPN